ncbi:MAG: nucleoside:proton symporter [Alphaproteobacteria bacterium]|nr:nucleoside:proton symporter [Alphaproteobacteria bacterium]
MDFPPQLQSALGLAVFIAIAWGLSENRRAFPWQTVIVGLGLQIVLAALLLGVPVMRAGLLSLNVVVDAIQAATAKGSSFVFGYTGGGTPPFEVKSPNAMVTIAFTVLPIVLVMSALSALLWHWRILPVVVKLFALGLERSMKIGGALGVGCASNIFLGMIEAPMLIKPYLEKMTRSELFTLFSCGLANVAGTVLVLFATVIEPVVPGALGHIIVASLLSLPASILLAKVMIPGDETTPATVGQASLYRSTMDAIATGAEDGMKMYLNIIAMLVVMISLVALANIMLGNFALADAPLSFERILGWLFAPIVWLIGVPWQDAGTAGSLMGTKTILNEFIAYLNMAALPPEALGERSKLLMVYAMCGFANLGSVGMMIAGVSALAPSRRDEIVQLSLWSIIPGTLATCMTAAVVGLLP